MMNMMRLEAQLSIGWANAVINEADLSTGKRRPELGNLRVTHARLNYTVYDSTNLLEIKLKLAPHATASLHASLLTTPQAPSWHFSLCQGGSQDLNQLHPTLDSQSQKKLIIVAPARFVVMSPAIFQRSLSVLEASISSSCDGDSKTNYLVCHCQ
ncbi:hypothetical protein BDR04DRAFT_234953 [Suillus decipiens]|nr:hypothetical protein BDR04DRAFT_234953 [Suillus decipiens]